MNEYSIEVTPDLKGVFDSLIENTGLTCEELINLGIFLYHPDIFLKLNKDKNNIENVKLWLFLDKTEQEWLKALCKYYDKTEIEIINDLLMK
ncbi:MAG: hypothetical protein HeimC2_23700 [Candidatus Heimdallarchaeota archaeon LC_2]|nr:MAG: hypothetical protein HeimC2_23690 [Candidatus Heimdallarchaeota archaeon LC_2]OLS24150.1 MAG: hypothetical protein HeimC2_23700 [Candidatus Heimdallarchaeota archaeon LC_2]